MLDTLILMLFVASLAPRALCQDVEIRGTNEKGLVDGGGQSRNIYSQSRPLSPHRMMHFGKRPVNQAPPTILVPDSFNLYQHDGQQDQAAIRSGRLSRALLERFNKSPSPYLFSIQLDQGQTLEALPDELASTIFGDVQPNKNLLYNLDRPSASEFGFLPEQQLQQVARIPADQKLLRMLSDDAAGSQNEEASGAGRVTQDNQASNQPGAINLSTRSIQSSRGNILNLPKAFIPSLYMDRHSSASMPSFGSYNKKAEPKDNFFMHFGRK